MAGLFTGSARAAKARVHSRKNLKPLRVMGTNMPVLLQRQGAYSSIAARKREITSVHARCRLSVPVQQNGRAVNIGVVEQTNTPFLVRLIARMHTRRRPARSISTNSRCGSKGGTSADSTGDDCKQALSDERSAKAVAGWSQ